MPDLREEFDLWRATRPYGVSGEWAAYQAATERVAKKEREESKEIEAVLKAILAESCDSEAESLVSMALYRRGHAAIRAREGKGGAG